MFCFVYFCYPQVINKMYKGEIDNASEFVKKEGLVQIIDPKILSSVCTKVLKEHPKAVIILFIQSLFCDTCTIDPVINDPVINDVLFLTTFFSCTKHFSIVNEFLSNATCDLEMW